MSDNEKLETSYQKMMNMTDEQWNRFRMLEEEILESIEKLKAREDILGADLDYIATIN